VLRAAGALDVAVAGGSFGPAPGRVLRLGDGEVLSLGAARGAVRAIVAASGGIDVPVVLGSRATCLSARFGGFQGRRLLRGDFLAVSSPPSPSSPPLLDASVDLVEPGAGDVVLRAFAGPDEAEFDEAGRAVFWGSRWTILPESNRMGLRLGGPSLGLQETASRASEGTTAGTVQVTADGHPIVLLAERPTTGGYARLAVVAAVDLGLLARTPPGRSVRFERIPVTEARSLLVARDVRLRSFPGGRT
jgi:antagonist of KipI